MTITFLAPDGTAITAQQFRQAQAATHGGGSGRRLGGRSGFRVDTPSNVLTATSTTWTLTPCAAMIDPGATTHQGMYGWSSDANATGSVTAADATYARKDIVYIQVNDSSAGDGSGALTAPVEYLAGTPAASPVAPALPSRSFLVGTISVPVAGGGSPTVVLNPARFAAAGAPLPVYSEAERDAIPDKYDGLTVQRRDVAGRPVETYDGTKWANGPAGISYTPTWAGAETWGTSPIINGVYWRHGNHIRVQAMIQAGASTSLGLAAISFSLPAGLPIGSDFMATGSGVWNSSGTSGSIRPVLTAAGPGQSTATVWATPGTSEVQTPGNAGWPWGTGTAFHVWIEYKTDAA